MGFGGRNRARTCDPLIKSQQITLIYQAPFRHSTVRSGIEPERKLENVETRMECRVSNNRKLPYPTDASVFLITKYCSDARIAKRTNLIAKVLSQTSSYRRLLPSSFQFPLPKAVSLAPMTSTGWTDAEKYTSLGKKIISAIAF